MKKIMAALIKLKVMSKRPVCFFPIVDKYSKILILGSFPGPLSLEKCEYYAYPRNQFWKMVFGLLGAEEPATYRGKVRALKAHRIALWDVIASCHRNNASDSNISKPVFNDIAGLLKRYPGIQAVFCNGTKSYSVYKSRHKAICLPVTYLPSTSPAHASSTFERKKKAWSRILSALAKT